MSNTTKKTTTSSTTSAAEVAPTKLEVLMTALLAGMQSALPGNITSWVLKGTSYTSSQLEEEMQAALTALDAQRTAKTAYLAASVTAKPVRAMWGPLAKALVANLKVLLGATNAAELAKFGITATARATPSQATKTVAQAKRTATVAAKKAAAAQANPASTTTVVIGPNGVQLAAPAVPVTK
jgi:hypothetical protein